MEDTLQMLFYIFLAFFVLLLIFFGCIAWAAINGVRMLLGWVRTGSFSWGHVMRKSNDKKSR